MNKTIALVWPKGGDILQSMPLAFGYLKSNTTYDIKIIDCMLDDVDLADRIRRLNPYVVGTSAWSLNYPEALEVLRIAKQVNSGIATVLGGSHATVAEGVIENKEVDFVFRGEAEFSFHLFLDELFKPKTDYKRIEGLVYRGTKGVRSNGIALIEDLDSIKLPDYNFINLEGYIKKGYKYRSSKERNAPIQATRGCPYKCAFCAVPLISGRKLRKHSIEYMIEWIQFLYKEHGIRGFNIVDDNFTLDVKYAKDFCRAVIKLGYKDIEFVNPNGIRMQRGNYELWDLMRQAGWRFVTIAPESGSERVLKRMNKGINPREVPYVVREIKRAGLKVHAFIMLGYPEETWDDLKKTAELLVECKPELVSTTIFQPMIGTPIYNELLKRGDIPKDYSLREFHDYTTRSYNFPDSKIIQLNAFLTWLNKHCK